MEAGTDRSTPVPLPLPEPAANPESPEFARVVSVSPVADPAKSSRSRYLLAGQPAGSLGPSDEVRRLKVQEIRSCRLCGALGIFRKICPGHLTTFVSVALLHQPWELPLVQGAEGSHNAA